MDNKVLPSEETVGTDLIPPQYPPRRIISYPPTRYTNLGNALRRARLISLRRIGGTGTGVLCDGDCTEGQEYAGATTVTYTFPGGSPVDVNSADDWMSYELDQIEDIGGRQVIYQTRRCAPLVPGGTPYCGLFGDEDFFWVWGPMYWTKERSPTPSDPYRVKVELWHHTGNFLDLFIDDPVRACWDTGKMTYTPVLQNMMDAFQEAYGGDDQYRYMTRSYDFFDDITHSTVACNGTPDPISDRIRISDPTGLIHEATGDGLPAVVISGDGESWLAQSQTYPEVWYEVTPTSCECPAFTQQVAKPFSSIRSWLGSNAGPIQPCKHMLALGIRLGENYDYCPVP